MTRLDFAKDAKRRHVARQGQTRNHTCHWPGCDAQVPPAMWGCKRHWFRLPKVIRDAIWTAYRPGQEDDMVVNKDYIDAAKAAKAFADAERRAGRP